MRRDPFRSFGRAPAIVGSNPAQAATMKDVEAAKVAIAAIVKAIESNPIGPAEVLAGGKAEWINRFLREMVGFRLVDRENAEILWAHFEMVHAARFGPPHYAAVIPPAVVLDNWFEASPMNAREVRQSFRVESASAPEARQRFYGPDGNPDRMLEELLDDIPDDELTKAANDPGGEDVNG